MSNNRRGKAMKQRKYTPEEKTAIMLLFLKRRKAEGISLRNYAGEIGIPYYTMRDIYRDPRYNPEWALRYLYSTQDNPSLRRKNRTANEPVGFVRIC